MKNGKNGHEPRARAARRAKPPEKANEEQPETRYLVAAIAGHERDEPLELKKYLLEVSVELEKSGDAATRFLDAGITHGPGEESITLMVQVTSEDFVVSQKTAVALELPRRGPSDGKARFDVKPKAAGRGTLTINVHKEGNFLLQMELAYSIGDTQMAAPVEKKVHGRTLTSAAQLRKRDLGMTIKPVTGGYECVVRGSTYTSVILKIDEARLADAIQVAVGSAHSCALRRGGRALCWGANEQGQLGIGHRVDREGPSFVAGGLRFASLVAGWSHTCALQADGSAFCWGSGGDGQLGDGDAVSRPHPVRVSGGHRFRSLAAGRAHTCGATTAGTVFCWGDNRTGQAGDPDSRKLESPTAVAGLSDVVKVVAGSLHSCALTGRGETICWGQNSYGQLGDGTTSDRARPAPVVGAPAFVDIAASAAHTCGVTREGDVHCWGYNLEGQLGDGTRTNRTRPVRVRPAAER
jgi:hypothetical protein